MKLKVAVVSVLALAGIAVLYYFLNSGPVPDTAEQNNSNQRAGEAALRKKAKEAAEHRDAQMLSCIAGIEAEYVTDVEREYNEIKVHGNPNGRFDLDPKTRHRIEHKKETAASNCGKEYGQTVSPAPSP